MSAPGKPAPSGNSNILFVGNLPFTTPWQVIKDAFSEAGKVRYTDLIADRSGRPKGSALVTFSNADSARRAVEMFNEKSFEGRRLIVRFFDDGPRPALVARDMQPSYARHAAAGKFRRGGGAGGGNGGGGGGNDEEEGFDDERSAPAAGAAGGAPHRLEDEDEEADAEDAAFYRLQRQARAAVSHPAPAPQDPPVSKRAARRAAAVAANAANAAPAGGAYDEHRPHGYDARSGDQHYAGAAPAAAAAGSSHLPVPKPRSLQEASRRIFVSNLPFDCTAQALRDTFQQIGGVERAEIILGRNGKSRGMGIVILATEDDARLAIAEFDGIEMAGRPMSVRLDNAQQQH